MARVFTILVVGNILRTHTCIYSYVSQIVLSMEKYEEKNKAGRRLVGEVRDVLHI